MHFVRARALLTRWNSVNVYRGCQHGCVYCDSRSACYRFTHPFEDVEVKENAPELLERVLRTRRGRVISSGSMSDPYQPCEGELGLTRRCLELIARHGFGASVITKSDLVLRDLDLLEEIHRGGRAVVQVSLTVADEALGRRLEPGVCGARRRWEVLKEFQRRGIPTVVWMMPLLPFLTDTRENVEALLGYCVDAGVRGVVCLDAGLTLREGSREHYYAALDREFPGLSDVYRREYGMAQRVSSPRRRELMELFHGLCEGRGILHDPEECFRYVAEFPSRQLTLF